MTIELKRNVPGFRDANGVFHPLRSASYIPSGKGRRKATVRDKKKYSRAKAGDLGKARQERALEDIFDREIRLEREAKEQLQKERDRIEREIAGDIYGESSGRTSRGKARSLVQYVRAQGGINTKFRLRRGQKQIGDLANYTLKDSGKRGLVTTTPGKGLGLDGMWQSAREAGYDVSSTDDLLARLDSEIAGGPVTYSTHGSMSYNPAASNIEYVYYATKIGDPDWAEIIAVSGRPAPLSADQMARLKAALKKDGYNRLRMSKVDLSKAPNFAGTIRRNPAAKKNPIRVLKHKFYVGQKLATRSIGDHDVIYRGTVVSRTPKFVTVKIDGDRELKRCGVKLYDGSEYIFPFGRYSMAPVFRAEKGDRIGNPAAKKNPDPVSTFASLAWGIASSLHIKEMLTKPTARKAAKRRGTTTAKTKKRTNPASSAKRSKGPKGDLYVLTIGSGDDLISVYLHDGDKDGFSKRFKTMAAAKAYATKSKVKLVSNPAAAKVNGIVSRAWARSRAKAEYARELRLAAAAERSRERRRKAEAKAKANPRRSAAGKKAVTRSAKANPRRRRMTSEEFRLLNDKAHPYRVIVGGKDTGGFSTLAKAREWVKRHGGSVKLTIPKKSAIRNPKSAIAKRRTFEMFQGRKATTAKAMPVSRHAPANLDQLGDLVEIKLRGGKVIKFNPRKFKLTAARGKLWIVGGPVAPGDGSVPVHVVNPVAEIDHVVYGTRKPHHGDHAYTHYIHKLGEESGKRPILCVDREGFPVIRGGNYKIEARGIVD